MVFGNGEWEIDLTDARTCYSPVAYRRDCRYWGLIELTGNHDRAGFAPNI
ncbi:MAG: hypothetical protein F6K47_03600 [Symploca sp. SIO2E6]|nr:hypothetical protein [Symploca sp. SIO2E6]